MKDLNAELGGMSAMDMLGLVPEGQHQAVCAEIFFHLAEQDVLFENRPTGEIEIVTQMLPCFEVLLPNGEVKVLDYKSVTIRDGRGKSLSPTSDASNIGKLLFSWSGGKKGMDLVAWLGSFKSLEGRNVVLNTGIKTSKKGQPFSEILAVQAIQQLPNQKINLLERSKDYVPALERNKHFFKPTEDGWLRVYKFEDKKEEEIPVISSSEMKATLGAQAPSTSKGKSVSTKPVKDADIPF